MKKLVRVVERKSKRRAKGIGRLAYGQTSTVVD